VIDKIDEIKQKYGIANLIFVGDRGMITQAVYENIDHTTVKTISALNHGNIQSLCDKGTIQLSLFDEKNIIEVIDGDTRYMLCKNPVMQQKETATRKRLLELTCAELDKIVSSTRKTKYPKPVRMGRAIDHYKMSKFIILEGSEENITYRLDNDKIEKESALDGCYIVFTDIYSVNMSAVDTVNNYKNLMKAEQAFRCLKTTQLEMRPIFHKTDDRIKCHVFLCMLAYYIMWHMKQRLKPLADTDGTGKDRKYSFDYVIECLKSIQKNHVRFMDSETFVITTPSEEQADILNLLKVSV
jgi:transposase